MDDLIIEAYLTRIGATRPVRPDADSLRDLQLRHLRTVPFENLSIHLDEPISLEEDPLLDKLLRRRRGGFCYELNGAFAGLLRALGYDVTLLAARVHTPVGLGPPLDHMALRVELDEPWLADVGFGRFSHYPLRLDDRGDQSDPAGTFLMVDAGDGDIDVHLDGKPAYRIEPHSRQLRDFDAMSWWQGHSPQSHFARSLVCSLLTAEGRVTLSGRTLVETEGTERTERVLESDRDVLAAYDQRFGFTLDQVPEVARPS